MNERLEQEIDKWFGITQRDAAGKPVQEVSDWKESPDVMMCMNVASIRGFAEYFYNLALADVREELEVKDEKYRIMRVSKESTIQQAREADLVVYVLRGLNNFVDNLTK